MGTTNNHTQITGTPDVRTALNTALGELDQAIANYGLPVAIFGHREMIGGGGNSSATTWNVRPISGLETDPRELIVIASDRFTPVAGTYLLIVYAGAYHLTGAFHRMRLYNQTQASVDAVGMSFWSKINISAIPLVCIFTANGTDAYEIHHYTSAAYANGLGLEFSPGPSTDFMQGNLIKIG